MRLPRLVLRFTSGDAPPTVHITGLDGSHLGPALSLWRATYLEDNELRDLIVEEYEPEEMFACVLELLLAQAHMVAEMEQTCPTDPCDGGARFLLRMAHSPGHEDVALLLHQAAETLVHAPHGDHFRVTPVPVLRLVDLNIHIAQLIESHTEGEFDFDAQYEALSTYLLTTLENS